jgi:hypothetical protein
MAIMPVIEPPFEGEAHWEFSSVFPSSAPRLKFRFPCHSEGLGVADVASPPHAPSECLSKELRLLSQHVSCSSALPSWSSRSANLVNLGLRESNYWALSAAGTALAETPTCDLTRMGVGVRSILPAEVLHYGE